jgi:NET1-associated nuclear protein 1 (U3 small nucleolar RNA-associated protein 17)
MCLKTWQISTDHGITHLAFPPPESDSNLLYMASRKSRKVTGTKIRLISLNLDNNNVKTLKFASGYKLLSFNALSNGEHTCLAYTSKQASYVYCPETDITLALKAEQLEHFTTMTAHPLEFALAIGTESGKILLWYCFDRSKTTEIVTSLHWHAHKVNSIAFASDSYMLTGGSEGVLVLWQLETKHKNFLPRLGSEITAISVSPDKTLYALGFLDNSIRILSATDLVIKQTIMGLKYATLNHLEYPSSTGMVLEPTKESMVLNGVPGTLQFFNAKTDMHVLEV